MKSASKLDATLLGLDLAWVSRNRTGAVALHPHDQGYRAAEPITLGDDRSILDWATGESAVSILTVLAIDAPLFAPNPPGTSRQADKRTTQLYGWAHAGVDPANYKIAARPMALAAQLEARNWYLCPYALRTELTTARHERRDPRGLFALEVYPHAACVGLFGLQRIISYKKGRVAVRRSGLMRLQDLLRERLPALSPPIQPFAHTDIDALRGRALKAFEDRLDALLCATMAAVFVQTPERCETAGADTAEEVRCGYIVVPNVPTRM